VQWPCLNRGRLQNPVSQHPNGAAQIFAVRASKAAEKVDYFVILSEAKNLSWF
jgi:hypothetical protein